MLRKAFVTAIIALSLSFTTQADRYGIWDDYEDYGSGSGRFPGDLIFGGLILLVGVPAAYFYLFDSYSNWNLRRQKNEKPIPKDDTTNWIFTLIGFAIVAFFLCFPALLITKWVAGAETVREIWWVFYFSFLGALYFYRRT